jgi:hypothetical protein
VQVERLAVKLPFAQMQDRLEEPEGAIGGGLVEPNAVRPLKVRQVPAASVPNVRPGDNLAGDNG